MTLLAISSRVYLLLKHPKIHFRSGKINFMKALTSYNPSLIEPKWQKYWKANKTFKPNMQNSKNPFYNLMMFPYPSAEGLHVGNMYAFTGSDIYGRYIRQKGFDVFEPIGLDGFGIHSENYAIKVNTHPASLSKQTAKNFYRQLMSTGNAYSWDSKLETYDPNYYKWTQWLFIKMYNRGLVERKKSYVNWCSSCKTVLADEQVEGGICERCKSVTIRKESEQWFFKITKYADKLLNNVDTLNWSNNVKLAQKNWIGKSTGARVEFRIANSQLQISVFTTRLDTIYGAMFLVLAPEHPAISLFLNNKSQITNSKRNELSRYVKNSLRKTEQQRKKEEKVKTGVDTGFKAIHPLTGKKISIWVADFVLMNYGAGAIMGVPAHDKRDFEFAKKFSLPIIKVIGGGKEYHSNYGKLVNSGKYSGMISKDAIKKILFDNPKICKATTNYHLRDWLISRQRYWGPPIPMIFCKKCGWLPVPEKDLPVILPYLDDYQPKGFGNSPLAQLEDWVEVICPKCGITARRETDVSDTFLDSSWYFLRYPSINIEGSLPWDSKVTKKWLPVDMYIGGAEHSVLHLLYSRFITMALYDMNYLNFKEPYKRFFAHGLLTKDGAKMSKSKGNVIIPDTYINKLGADTLRMYLMFLGPFFQGGDFTDSGIMGIRRFLDKVWNISHKIKTFGVKKANVKEAEVDLSFLHQTIKKVGDDIESLKFNTSIAAMMSFLKGVSTDFYLTSDILENWKKFLRILAPFAPHITEELWYLLGEKESIHLSSWPEYDINLIKAEIMTVPITVNGKLRSKISISAEIGEKEMLKLAKLDKKALKYLEGKKIKKEIYIKGKIVNFVV